jgi:hypothetical protein
MAFDVYERLALEGGPKAKRTPFRHRKRHGELGKKYLGSDRFRCALLLRRDEGI